MYSLLFCFPVSKCFKLYCQNVLTHFPANKDRTFICVLDVYCVVIAIRCSKFFVLRRNGRYSGEECVLFVNVDDDEAMLSSSK